MWQDIICVLTSQSGVPHKTWAPGRVLEGNCLDAREKLAQD